MSALDATATDPGPVPVRHLYLDLEDTCITPVLEGWPNVHLINVNTIKAYIAEYKPDYLHIFSFAVWNDYEKKLFQLYVQPRLEKIFDMKIHAVPTVDGEIIPACCKVMNIAPGHVEFQELSDFWSKHEAFRLCMRNLYRSASTPVEVRLLDDAVYNETFEWPDLKVKGRIVNIDIHRDYHGICEPESPAPFRTGYGLC